MQRIKEKSDASVNHSTNQATQAWMTAQNDSNPSPMEARCLLRPLILSMKLTANVGWRWSDRNKEEASQTKTTFLQTLSVGYRVAVVVAMFLSVCRTIAAVVDINASLFAFAVTSLGWTVQCFVNALIAFKIFHTKHGNAHRFMEFWDDKIVRSFAESVDFPVATFRKKQLLCIVTLTTVLVVNSAAGIVLGSGTISSEIANYFVAPFSISASTLFFHAVSHISLTLCWTSPVLYVVVMCIVLKSAFNAFGKSLDKEILSTSPNMPPTLDKFRRMHLDLCKSLEYLDRDFRWFFASNFVFTVSVACFCIYQLLNTQMDAVTMVIIAFWLVASVTLAMLLTGFAAGVNEAAHAPLDCLFNLGLADNNSERNAQLNLFLAKLTGTQTGFTALGLLTITNELILTLAGLFLTYFVLLYTL